jgi:hypothetical protein
MGTARMTRITLYLNTGSVNEANGPFAELSATPRFFGVAAGRFAP